ncbi:hypothetical protein BDDG_01427 [Blastomyces dermatitidis ATCC 18188]|uniref:Uncharacterized protein n=1 Tax=Ajellomyces dermatitidis (strain ATCC 18188 / CBS 674.68) TaxID=653446 RepID=F2T5H7_AJEDA|nr:hypothetical protein BDDG_01427 [Blastomyces dermatitidis ATCC 18188]
MLDLTAVDPSMCEGDEVQHPHEAGRAASEHANTQPTTDTLLLPEVPDAPHWEEAGGGESIAADINCSGLVSGDTRQGDVPGIIEQRRLCC